MTEKHDRKMKINQHTSHPSAFISSTFIDLYEDRQAVAETLRGRGLNVNALDIKPASTQTSKKEIVSGIKESDFVVLIIGDRFGSTLESMTGSKTKSITWWEYDTAIKMGKPVIAYFKNINSYDYDPKSHDDCSDPLYNKKRRLFERFKKIVSNRHNPAYYSDFGELPEKIDASLISIYRAGVKELDTKNRNLTQTVAQLEAQVKLLESRLNENIPATSSSNAFGLLGVANTLTTVSTPSVSEHQGFGFGGGLLKAGQKNKSGE